MSADTTGKEERTDGANTVEGLRQLLLQRLLGGEFADGARFYSVREVAQWPGATAHLAQRVLAQLCREGYLESVPKKGLFVRTSSKRGRPVDEQSWRTLVLIIPHTASRQWIDLTLPHLLQMIERLTWRVEVLNAPANYQENGGFWFAEQVISRRPTAAVWLFPVPQEMLLVRYLVASGITTVTYNRDYSQTGALGVVTSIDDVTRRLFDELYDIGKRRFAVLAVEKTSPTIAAFPQIVVARARERGIEDVQVVTLAQSEGGEVRPAMRQRVTELLEGPNRPDAVLCAELYSLFALELWLADNRDVRVPQDLGVASFDRVERSGIVRIIPPIPNAEMDHETMLHNAMEMIEEELAGRRVEPKVRFIPALWIELGDAPSVPAATSDADSAHAIAAT